MNVIGHNSRSFGKSMFAIAFDLDTDTLKKSYHNASWQNAYNDIARFLRDQGFDRQQGSVYFGGPDVDMVKCQTAVQRLTLNYEWFAPAVRDIRMLRIEDNNDLTPAIELALEAKKMAR
ncbi:virulence factor [Aliihoeflea sp. 2WW]|uniref:virulence factor n=1 Tax=Aliihoeflea sp. 2WW TaxID=1381123 RepID=UPI001FCC0F0D|nr:virulence factor [Aliihoeflea sp. 2WW]